MLRRCLGLVVCGLALGILPQYGLADEQTENKSYKIEVDINKEDAEVGKKRLELLDKLLSPKLIEQRRKIVRQFEKDYNDKIKNFLQGITSPNSKNTVITHVDLRLFDPGFKEQIEVERDVSITIILGRGGFDLWKKEQTEEQALDKLRQLISASFRIPAEHVSLTLGP